ncbi:hypothetical protein HPB50_015786 [Hyalomma asiaticum]|uniref:Uncharacterized protein n=1 Tax=Hyalomma asiaticum TaxID=266040 RepID=A0ACB7RIZ5_HYAAI|nr:hypothetical protein HPB50_015786 [Hyalomma asiaticum]
MDNLDTDTEKRYRQGLGMHGDDNKPKSPLGLNSSRKQTGDKLVYTQKITERDAIAIRRMLRKGPAVRKLVIRRISLRYFKLAFDDLDECPSLKDVLLEIECRNMDFGTTLTGVFRNLHSLDVRCDNAGSGFAGTIASYIRQNKSLRRLCIGNSCGGDKGAATLVEALKGNDTLKKFTLLTMQLSSDTLVGFAEMLTSNSTIELVDLRGVCPVEKDNISPLLEDELYDAAFKRLRIVWPQQLLPELTVLVRRQACCHVTTVNVTSSVDEAALREFFDAAAATPTLDSLEFDSEDDTFDELAIGIASLVECTTTLRHISSNMCVNCGTAHQLLAILDALKVNRSITTFKMCAESVTPQIAKCLSELLAVNNKLTCVTVCDDAVISPKAAESILPGLRINYTLTKLTVSSDPTNSEAAQELETLLERNIRLEKKAAEFVVCGADVSEQEGVDALTKLHSSVGLAKRVRKLTGKTKEEALQEIHTALARLCA